MIEIIPTTDLNSLIDPHESNAYLNDLWNPDYGQGLYFSALQDLNEYMFIPAKLKGKWIYAPHATMDGMSFLEALQKRCPELKLKHAMNTKAHPPKFLGWIRALFTALKSKPLEKHHYINQFPYDKKYNQFVQTFSIEFSLEESAELMKVNLTSFVLEKISKIFMSQLSFNQTSRWMIPVNIRGHFKEPKLSKMSASYIGINCSMDDSSESLKSQIVNKLKKGEHWGYWLIGKLGLLGGRKMIMNGTIKSLNKKKSQWFASLSNLGNIGGDENSPELIIMPIVRWHRPVACLICIYRNRLYLNMCFHPSLNLNESTLDKFKHEIYQSIISK